MWPCFFKELRALKQCIFCGCELPGNTHFKLLTSFMVDVGYRQPVSLERHGAYCPCPLLFCRGVLSLLLRYRLGSYSPTADRAASAWRQAGRNPGVTCYPAGPGPRRRTSHHGRRGGISDLGEAPSQRSRPIPPEEVRIEQQGNVAPAGFVHFDEQAIHLFHVSTAESPFLSHTRLEVSKLPGLFCFIPHGEGSYAPCQH